MTVRHEGSIVEFARTAGDYARHRAGFPQSFFARLPADRVAAFDAAHAEMLASRFPEDPLAVPHCIFAVIGRKSG